MGMEPRGWRWFAAEYAVVFVGVLTALGAEQGVQALDHHRDVKQLRRALDQELAWNLARMKDIADTSTCTTERLNELQRWSDDFETARPQPLARVIDIPGFLIFRTAAWDSATSATLDQMPADVRIAYANFYAGVGNNRGYRQMVLDAWRDLAPYQNQRLLTRDDRMRVAHDINDIRYATFKLAGNYLTWRDEYAPPLGILAEKAQRPSDLIDHGPIREELCRPILAQSTKPTTGRRPQVGRPPPTPRGPRSSHRAGSPRCFRIHKLSGRLIATAVTTPGA